MKKISFLALGISFLLVGCQEKEPLVLPQVPTEIVEPVETTISAPSTGEVEAPVMEVIEKEIEAVVPAESVGVPVENPLGEVIEAEFFADKDISFPRCDTRWQFKSESWYDDFVSQLASIPDTGEINVAQICLSNDESLVVALLNGNVQETGGVVRYIVEQKSLEKAELTNTENDIVLYNFKGRVDTTIPMTGGFRTQTCESTFRLNYEFTANTLKPLRKCETCNAGAEVCTKLY